MSESKETFKIVNGKNDRSEFVFSVIVKRSYSLAHGKPPERLEQDHPLRETDAYYDQGDPDWATLKYEYELTAFKPAVDVVVVGKAYAPDGRPTQRMHAGVRIGTHQKVLSITGDRQCHFREDQVPVVSDPEEFTQMELRYERAYGGQDLISDENMPFYYPRNMLGAGLALTNNKERIQGLALPNIEDPNDMLTPERIVIGDVKRWHEQPLPQSFGWLQRSWYPRCANLGIYPAHTDSGTVTPEERMGLVPPNHVALAKQSKLPSYNARMNNGGSFGLVLDELRGNEPVILRGLTPGGRLEFDLPDETPQIALDIGRGEQQLAARLDTVSIRPDDKELDLIWRGCLVYEGYDWWPKMTCLEAQVH